MMIHTDNVQLITEGWVESRAPTNWELTETGSKRVWDGPIILAARHLCYCVYLDSVCR